MKSLVTIGKAAVGPDGRVSVRMPGTRAAKAKFTGPEGGLIEKYEMRDGKMEDRSVVFSRAVWKMWGGRQMVIPDLATSSEKFVAAVERGNAVCRKYFPHYTLYCVGI